MYIACVQNDNMIFFLSIGSTIGNESTRFESGKPRKQTKQGVYFWESWKFWNS